MYDGRLLLPRQMTAIGALLVLALIAVSGLIVTPGARADTFDTHDAVVVENASFTVPEVLDGRVEAITVVGNTVVVGGTFTQVRSPGGATLNLPYIFAFNKATGQIDTNFGPSLNDAVWTLESSADGASVFVGGKFTTVNGQANKKGLTKLDLTGNRISAFAGRTDGRVKDMVRFGNVLYIGGNFTKVISTDVAMLAALDATTGQPLPVIDFVFADPYSAFNNQTMQTVVGSLSVDEVDVTPDGQTLVIAGNFSSIDGQGKSRLAVIDVSTSTAFLADWDTDVFDVQCKAGRFPQYILGLDVSPDGTYFVTGTVGGYTDGNPACDTVVRWDLTKTGTGIEPTWVAYNGGDSVYEVAISDEVVYAGGHFRWFNNGVPPRNDKKGPGAVDRRGLVALDPLNGLPLSWRSDRSPRGLGTFQLLVDDDGLWVGDDTDYLNGEYHPRLKFLPLAGGEAIPRPQPPTLPTTIFTSDADSLDAESYDGNAFGAPMELSSGPDWADVRGMVGLSGALFYGRADGTFWVRSFDGTTLAARQPVPLNGLTATEFDIANIGGMYFDHDQGRLYYTLMGSSSLYYRYFTPEHPILGSREFELPPSPVVPWDGVRGMDRIGDQLYFGYANGTLHRVDLNGSEPVPGTHVVLSGPARDGRDWSSTGMSFLSAGDLFGPPSTLADFEFTSSGSASQDSWQIFPFPVASGDDVTVKLEWDDPGANVNVFLRDETGATVEGNASTDGSPKWLTATSTSGGEWSVAVKIKQGSTGFDVLVNPFEEPPTPRAEHEFASTGSATQDSWQTFSFPVTAGEALTVELSWDDPAAELNGFLRDETGATIEGDRTSAGSPKVISAVAATSGTWSVAVKIKAGQASYEVLVNPL